jgi:ATP-grasp domain
MYLGIDFLITSGLRLYLIEVNVGLPGGAQEYDLTYRVNFGQPSGIFDRVEKISQQVYGKTFQDYIHSLPFMKSLKFFKIWMDGKGPFPDTLHPGLRLEDKWVQYQLLKMIAPMPETMVFDPGNRLEIERFSSKKEKVILKRRLGRGGKDLQVITAPASLWNMNFSSDTYLLQEYVESKINRFSFSIRSVAFGGEFICMYANLADRPTSNHGILAFVSPGDSFGLSDNSFKTESFNQKSWEAMIWFGEDEPKYLRHNLYEDEVAETTLRIPEHLIKAIEASSVKIERFYEGLDFVSLPKACFEE